MPLQNFVVFNNGTRHRMHFARAAYIEKSIVDPVTRFPKVVQTLELLVDELDGHPTSTVFSVTAQKLEAQLAPWVENARLTAVAFILTASGDGHLREWTVEVVPRGERVS